MSNGPSPAVSKALGAWPGYVYDADDSTQSGLIRAIVPGLFSNPPGTPYWCWPLGWASSPTPQRGCAFPVEPNTPVVLFFVMGDPEAGAFWMRGASGAPDGVTAAPTPYLTANSAKEARCTTVLHEDSEFLIYITDTYPIEKVNPIRELVLTAKDTGSTIRINASDGLSKKAVSISIEAETQLQLLSKGSIHIDAPRVLLNGKLLTGGSKVGT